VFVSSEINEIKITKGCEDGWTRYRNSCFKISSNTFANPQSVSQSSIEISCNHNESRMATLYSSDINHFAFVKSNGFDGELWFDVYRSSMTQTVFFSRNNLSNLTYDSTTWDGGLSDYQCATWKVDKQKFKAHKCSESRNFICEMNVQSKEVINSKTFECCPKKWIFYRGSCFIDSGSATYPQDLNSTIIQKVCNESSARLALLANSDFNKKILKFTNKELWIDARRDNVIVNSFYTNDELSSIQFNSSTWESVLTNGEW
jgi:hypothetical protein